jgi:hypothetical protein
MGEGGGVVNLFPHLHCEYCRYHLGSYCNATEDTERIGDDTLCRCDYFYPKTEYLEEYGEGSGEPDKRRQIFAAIDQERKRQDEKWGEQNYPIVRLGHNYIFYNELNSLRNTNARLFMEGEISWSNILMEEVYKAFAETNPEKQREELVQVAAVAVQIIEYLDRKREEDRESQ